MLILITLVHPYLSPNALVKQPQQLSDYFIGLLFP